MKHVSISAYVSLIVAALSCHASAWAENDQHCQPHEEIAIEVLDRIEREERAFTQGFEFFNGKILESTGGYDASTKLILLQKDGSHRILSEAVQADTFGEGLTVLSGQIFQATWLDGRLFVFETDGTHLRTMDLPFEGWGLTNDGKNLFLTDGTSTMGILDPSDLSVIRKVSIRLGERLLPRVNELEWVNGKIYGNVLLSDKIVRIEPSTGCIDGIIDASVLRNHLPAEELAYLATDENFVLNGIAYDHETSEMYLTGKNWKYVFKVMLK